MQASVLGNLHFFECFIIVFQNLYPSETDVV